LRRAGKMASSAAPNTGMKTSSFSTSVPSSHPFVLAFMGGLCQPHRAALAKPLAKCFLLFFNTKQPPSVTICQFCNFKDHMADSEFLSTRQAALRLGVSLGTVQNMVESGVLDAWKTAGGHRRIPAGSVDNLLARRRKQANRPGEPPAS
jgi:excisionase family DNA binding protein